MTETPEQQLSKMQLELVHLGNLENREAMFRLAKLQVRAQLATFALLAEILAELEGQRA